MTMETQVVSMEDDEAYSVQFFDDEGTAVSVYFQNPQHVHLSTADAVNGERDEQPTFSFVNEAAR
ncbi:hypothetical protein [Brucella tritici]|uniref:hypothetical protein n=1 Tax=Brucella tritici TaxID=94626 RepID=UPI0020013A59|nr:hypothetical protein [Brucella tritici]